MDFIVKNNFFSLGGSSKVLDQNNNNLLTVKGRIFSFSRKKKIVDLNGKLLYTVRNKLITFIHRVALIYDENNNLIATVTRNIRVRSTFTVEGNENVQIIANGPIGLGWDMSILKTGQEIGHIKRPYVSLTDTFNVSVNKQEDLPFMTALVIAIDNIQDRAREDANVS